jgi:putative spermidine/putrescine transport system substrate-binding protein
MRIRISGLGVAVVLIAAACSGSPAASTGATGGQFNGRTLTVQSYGGAVAEAEKAAFYAPFEAETGAKVNVVESTGESAAQLKTQVDSGNVEWDLISGWNEADMRRLANDGLLEKIDLTKVPGTNDLAPGTFFDYGVADEIDAVVATYSTKDGVKPLTSFKDFFDVQGFPGPREAPGPNWGGATIYLMIALLADGVPRDQLFPLDIPRALKVWDRVHSSIEVYYDSGNQMAQALRDDAVRYCLCWDGRVQQARKVNPDWAYSYVGGETHNSFFGIVKGSKNVDLALAFLQFTTDPQRQAIFVENIGYSAPNPKAVNFLPDSLRPFLSTTPENRAKLLFLTPAENEIVAKETTEDQKAWTTWLSK